MRTKDFLPEVDGTDTRAACCPTCGHNRPSKTSRGYWHEGKWARTLRCSGCRGKFRFFYVDTRPRIVTDDHMADLERERDELFSEFVARVLLVFSHVSAVKRSQAIKTITQAFPGASVDVDR